MQEEAISRKINSDLPLNVTKYMELFLHVGNGLESLAG